MFKKFLALAVMLFAAAAMAAVDVNSASEAELDGVSGIGPVTSKLILAERKKGQFKSWDDFVERVKGVGEARAAKLSDAGLTVGGARYKPGKVASEKVADKTEKADKAAFKATSEKAKSDKQPDKPATAASKAEAARAAASARK